MITQIHQCRAWRFKKISTQAPNPIHPLDSPPRTRAKLRLPAETSMSKCERDETTDG